MSWEKLAENLPISGNSLRIAFSRNSVNQIYLDEIAKVLGLTGIEQYFEEPSKKYATSSMLGLEKDGVFITMEEIAVFADNNYQEFFEYKYFKKDIELRVAKKLVELTNDSHKLKEFLNS